MHRLFLITIILLLFSFAGCSTENTATADASSPSCCVCSGDSYYAPCLINTSTGLVTELNVFDSRMVEPVETYTTYPPGIMSCSTIEDTCVLIQDIGVSCSITVPTVGNGVNATYFCERCMSKIAITSTYGYILADLDIPADARFFEITDGGHYSMRDYNVAVTITEEERFEILVIPVEGG